MSFRINETLKERVLGRLKEDEKQLTSEEESAYKEKGKFWAARMVQERLNIPMVAVIKIIEDYTAA